ncbi:unnamed protein product [Urochloa humidicola]
MGAEPERDGKEQRRPLLSSSPPASTEQHQQQYQFLGRSSSSVLRGGGGDGVGGLEMSPKQRIEGASHLHHGSISAREHACRPTQHSILLLPNPPTAHPPTLPCEVGVMSGGDGVRLAGSGQSRRGVRSTSTAILDLAIPLVPLWLRQPWRAPPSRVATRIRYSTPPSPPPPCHTMLGSRWCHPRKVRVSRHEVGQFVRSRERLACS